MEREIPGLTRPLPVHARISESIWVVQGWGMVLITFLSFFPAFFHFQEYLFFLFLFLAVGTAWWEQRRIFIKSPIDLPLLLFISWVLISLPFATDVAYSFQEWRKLATQGLVFYWAIIVFDINNKKTLIHQNCMAVILGESLLSMYAIFDFWGRGGTWKDRLVRANALSSDYNWLSTYMVIAIPLVIAAGISMRQGWQRLVALGALVLAILAQVFSYTRAGWLGMLVQGMALGLFTARRKLVLWILGGCLAVGLGLVLASKFGFHRDTVDLWTLETRLAAWKAGVLQVMDHPFVGIGFGNNTFNPMIIGYPGGDRPMGLHNTFLMVVVGSGLPALLCLVWLLIRTVRTLIHRAGKTPDIGQRAILLGVGIMVMGFVVRNFFDYMFTGSLAYLFWIILALGFHVAYSNQGKKVVL